MKQYIGISGMTKNSHEDIFWMTTREIMFFYSMRHLYYWNKDYGHEYKVMSWWKLIYQIYVVGGLKKGPIFLIKQQL